MNTTALPPEPAEPAEPAEPIEANKIQTIKSIKETICSQVLERLGKPIYFFKIEAGNVGGNSHRVNVWCETPAKGECLVGGYEISDSFYVKVSPEGGIISSSPSIEQKY